MMETSQILLAHHLKALKLPTFLREYDKGARLCAAEGVDHPRYLMRLAEMVMIDRERRMVDRRIKAAKFPTVKSLEASTSWHCRHSTRCWSWSWRVRTTSSGA
jgi:hypothetical protein